MTKAKGTSGLGNYGRAVWMGIGSCGRRGKTCNLGRALSARPWSLGPMGGAAEGFGAGVVCARGVSQCCAPLLWGPSCPHTGASIFPDSAYSSVCLCACMRVCLCVCVCVCTCACGVGWGGMESIPDPFCRPFSGHLGSLGQRGFRFCCRRSVGRKAWNNTATQQSQCREELVATVTSPPSCLPPSCVASPRPHTPCLGGKGRKDHRQLSQMKVDVGLGVSRL